MLFFEVVDVSDRVKLFIYFSLCYLYILVLGFRLNVPDLENYEFYYFRSNEIIESKSLLVDDYVFLKINHVLRSIGVDFNLYKVVSSSVFVIGFMFFGYKNVKYIFIYALVFFSGLLIVKGMAQIQNGIALVPVIFGLKKLVEGKKIWFVILVVLGGCLHLSVMIFLLLYFFVKIDNNFLLGWLLIAFLLVMFMYGSWLGEYSFRLFDLDRMYNYADRYELSGRKKIYLYLLIFFLVVMFLPKLKLSDWYNVAFWGFFLMMLVRVIFFKFGEIGTRLGDNLSVFDLLIIPAIYSLFSQGMSRVLALILIGVYSFISFYYYVLMPGGLFGEYDNILF